AAARVWSARAVRQQAPAQADVPGRGVHDRLPRGGGGAAILAVSVMTDTPPRACWRREARRAAFVLTYQLDVRAGSDLDELAARYLADTGMDVPPYTREVVE